VRTLIAGPSVFICDQCVSLCQQVIGSDPPGAGPIPIPTPEIIAVRAWPSDEVLDARLATLIDRVLPRVTSVDEITLETSKEICALLNAHRLMIFAVSEDGRSLVSKVKTGINAFKDVSLPIAEDSIAGCVALKKRMVNVKDVYDEEELRAVSPRLRFLKVVDQRTGYRTKQQLVAPIMLPGTDQLFGVIQMINNCANAPFPKAGEVAAAKLAEALATTFKRLEQ